jgi:hypothetical protein
MMLCRRTWWSWLWNIKETWLWDISGTWAINDGGDHSWIGRVVSWWLRIRSYASLSEHSDTFCASCVPYVSKGLLASMHSGALHFKLAIKEELDYLNILPSIRYYSSPRYSSPWELMSRQLHPTMFHIGFLVCRLLVALSETPATWLW